MIINISGTGGAGKSTIVRQVMDLYDVIQPKIIEGRKQPLYYLCVRTQGQTLFIPGHYETPCGGCDTLSTFKPTYDFIYDLVRRNADLNRDVLFEGMLVNDDVNRTVALHKDGYPLMVLTIDLPLKDCIESVNIRRRKKNPNAKPVATKNTSDRYHRIRDRRIPRLRAVGVDVRLIGREAVYSAIKQALGLREVESQPEAQAP